MLRVLLEGNATGVAVTNGRITGFGLGVDGDTLGPASGSRFANLQISAASRASCSRATPTSSRATWPATPSWRASC